MKSLQSTTYVGTNGTSYTYKIVSLDAALNSVDAACSASVLISVPPAPTITSLTPNVGLTGGGTTITITVTGFSTSPSISIGGTACTTSTYVSTTSVTCVAPTKTAGDYDVVVRNSDSQTATSTAGYTYSPANVVSSTLTTMSTARRGIIYSSNGTSSGLSGSYTNSEIKGFLIQPTGASSVTLTFQSFGTETGYDYLKIYNGTNTTGSLLSNTAGTTAPSAQTVSSGNIYLYFTSDGSVTSTGFAATWDSTVAGPPGAFTVSTPTFTGTQASVSWGSSSGASSYTLKYGSSPGSYSTTVSNAASPYTVTGLNSTGPYYFMVIATNAQGSTNATSEAFGSPTAPGSFVINTPTLTNGQPLITWGASVGALSYNISYGTSSGNYSTTLSSVTSPYTVTGLSSGSTYYFMVTALTVNGSTNGSSQVSATPALPGAFTITNVNAAGGQPILTWAASANAASYTVKYGTSAGSYPNPASSSAVSPYTFTGLTAGTPYYFMVTAVNSYGNTDATAGTSVTAGAPGAFTINTPTYSYGQPALSWGASAGASTYTVKYGTTAGTYDYPYTSGITATSVAAVTGLTANTPYYFMITAVNASGNTDATTYVTATPTVPTSFTATAPLTNGQPVITWTGPSNAQSYSIKYGTALGVYSTTISSATSPTTVSGLSIFVSFSQLIIGLFIHLLS